MTRLTCLAAVLLAGVATAQEPRLGPDNSTSLFDGKTLSGWAAKGGRYDGKALWAVEEGAIVGRQGPGRKGGLLYTTGKYANFIFTVETKIDHPFDSGIFVRMVPRGGGKGGQVTLDYRPGGEIGGIYSDGYLQHNKDAKAKWIKDDWNRFTVRCMGKGMHLTVWMNGKQITDYRLPAGSKGYAPTGLIGVQVHGGARTPDEQSARFRNVYVRELPEFDAALFAVDDRGLLTPTKKGTKLGWRALFNGKDLTGWKPSTSPKDYVVKDGVLHMPKNGRGGQIITKEDFRDFSLHLEFRIADMANSGLFLRADRKGGNPAYTGCEIQILDDFNWERVTNSKLKPWQFSGGLYGSVPPKVKDALRPNGQWNRLEVTYRGTRLAVRLNGSELYDVDTLKVPGKPFAKRVKSGFIGLQRYSSKHIKGDTIASFRNILIRRL